MLESHRRFFAVPWCAALVSSVLALAAQPFTGVNGPGESQTFQFTVGTGDLTLSVGVEQAEGGYSHLLLKRGAAPTDTDFDFIAQDNGSNAIYLERPELAPGDYFARVRTPGDSPAHSFTLTVDRNLTDLRSAGKPAMKLAAGVQQGHLTPGSWNYFRVEIPAGSPGWRLVLNSSGTGDADLYMRRGAPPNEFAADKSSLGQQTDTLIYTETEAQAGPYYIGVFLPPAAGGNTAFTLTTEIGYYTTLAWDPGTTDAGTAVQRNPSDTGGDYYFKVVTQGTAVGAWRTALNVTSGEADLYLLKDGLPALSNYNFKSDLPGSDGFVVPAGTFQPGETWFLLVHARQGSQWNLVSGEAFVQDLGALPPPGTPALGFTIGAEGSRFFRTSIPTDTLAWRLGLGGRNHEVSIKRGSVPFLFDREQGQARQLLVVPPILAGGELYFVSVSGVPGQSFDLDSTQQGVRDIDFTSVTEQTVSGYGYTTYRVQVPIQQIGWELTAIPLDGDPNLAVRRESVPNELFNDAFSEVSGLVADSLTLVPPTLSDGTFFITVYGGVPHRFRLQSGNPVVTDVTYLGTTVNEDRPRVGWRYYRVANIPEQLGTLGWDLSLLGAPPGTQIALRRNAVPSQWNYRSYGGTGVQGHYDYLQAEFLQRPGHQADIWYIGVYNPAQALGGLTLVRKELTFEPEPEPTFEPLNFDGTSIVKVNVQGAKWLFFQVIVPEGALGWDARLLDVTGDPQLVIARDKLPDGLATTPWNYPYVSPEWPSGWQWAAGLDWTGSYYDPSGTYDAGRILVSTLNNPLQNGTYYIGVRSASGTGSVSYRLLSRGIGPNLSIPIAPLAFNGGQATKADLAAREAAYYRVEVPESTASWRVRLTPTDGEALLFVQKALLPNIGAGWGNTAQYGGIKMQKAGREHYYLLPMDGKTVLDAGTYYLAVVSEGRAPAEGRIGAGTASFVLESIGPTPVPQLGTVSSIALSQADTLEGGEAKGYQFVVPVGIPAIEVRLDDRQGEPFMVLRRGPELPNAAAYVDSYGADGGYTSGVLVEPRLLTLANPEPGVWSVVVKARRALDGASFPNAAYTLNVVRAVPRSIAFDGGSVSTDGQSPNTWRFFRVDVPATADGWDFRLVDVTGGSPEMVISRDVLPPGLYTWPWTHPHLATEWPSGWHWVAGRDWTGFDTAPDGAPDLSRALITGKNNPLTPGTYYIGVLNVHPTDAAAYRLVSRGVGVGFSIPITNLAPVNGVVANAGLPAREAAYYRVEIAANTTGFRARLNTTSGEAFLVVQKDVVPNGYAGNGTARSQGVRLRKAGHELYDLLPEDGQLAIAAGTYYLVVVSEGQNPEGGRAGAGATSYVLETRPPLAPIALGTVSETPIGGADSVEGGGEKAYQFTVPVGMPALEARLENRQGNPAMILRAGEQLPAPGLAEAYGVEGGYGAGAVTQPELLTIVNPNPGIWTLVVKSVRNPDGTYPDASYTVRVNRAIPVELGFDNGAQSVTSQPAGTWRFFAVSVPDNANGWDLRLVDARGGAPEFVVSRDVLPAGLFTSPWVYPHLSTEWASGYHWAAGRDWTGFTANPDGSPDLNRALITGMSNPLSPGRYFIGVVNASPSEPTSYTMVSRGIGAGFSLPIEEVAFEGGASEHPGLLARQGSYYKVQVPPGVASWKVRLTTLEGEAFLIVQKGVVPNLYSQYWTAAGGGKAMRKAGPEHYTLLPDEGFTELAPGPYYLVVVGEGINPNVAASQPGDGASRFKLESLGVAPVTALGSLSPAQELPDGMDAGETKLYSFEVPPGVPAFEVRLLERAGNPHMVLRAGGVAPTPNYMSAYGADGGYYSGISADGSIITIPNSAPGTYRLSLKAEANNTGLVPDATYRLRLSQKTVQRMNFSVDENGNGFSHVVSGLLDDNERAFYQVTVPATYHGLPVLGWKLDIARTQGNATFAVNPGLLPADWQFFGTASAVIVPPYLTPGTWYVEVRGNGASEYSLSSQPMTDESLREPAWIMPVAGNPNVRFGDTGADGVDLARDGFHYYAVRIPPANGGLIRMMLEAISGNPDLYIREGGLPTLSHRSDGLVGGTVFDRFLAGAGTEYGNWVPMNRRGGGLTAGVWYIAVYAAGGSNVRYRLHLSTGTIEDLPLDGGSTVGLLAAGDWRYYRVQIPLDPPINWNITFAQLLGDVVMHIRDTVPPGLMGWPGNIYDWSADYTDGVQRLSYDQPGAITIGLPPMRPGHAYYIGFRAVTDATFTIGSAVSGGTLGNRDDDGDGLRDAWEYRFFGDLTSENGTGDPDGDGNTNLEESQDGTDPTDSTSYFAKLRLIAVGGQVAALPDIVRYPLNSTVRLTAIPDNSFEFFGWAGGATGNANPLILTMDGHKTVTGLFNQFRDLLMFRSPTVLPSGEFRVTLGGTLVGKSYTIEGSNDLVHWETVSVLAGTGSPVPIGDPAAAGRPMRFYRAIER
jgi:hypothetical protein